MTIVTPPPRCHPRARTTTLLAGPVRSNAQEPTRSEASCAWGELARGRGDRGAGGAPQRIHLVQPLPRQINVRASEVPVGRRRLVDRPAQVQRLDDARRAQIEV